MLEQFPGSLVFRQIHDVVGGVTVLFQKLQGNGMVEAIAGGGYEEQIIPAGHGLVSFKDALSKTGCRLRHADYHHRSG